MEPLDAIGLIAVAEPSKLGPLAGDLARLIFEGADTQIGGEVDKRSWAAIDAARAFAAGELGVDDLDRVDAEAVAAVSHPSAQRVESRVAAALAAGVARAVARDLTENAAALTKVLFTRTRRVPVSDDKLSDLLGEHVAALEIFGDHRPGD